MALTKEQKVYIDNHFMSLAILGMKDRMSGIDITDNGIWEPYTEAMSTLESIRDSETLMQDVRGYVDDRLNQDKQLENSIYEKFAEFRYMKRQKELNKENKKETNTDRRELNMKNMKYPFTLVDNTEEHVILKNEAKSSLDVARFPYVNSQCDYITVTKGRNHILTIINENGGTFDFHWGERGYSLVTEAHDLLRKKVVEFVEKECAISLEVRTIENPVKAHIFYNSNFGLWQGKLIYRNGETANVWDKSCCDEIDMAEYLTRYNENFDFEHLEHGIAQTGIDVWYMGEEKTKDITRSEGRSR